MYLCYVLCCDPRHLARGMKRELKLTQPLLSWNSHVHFERISMSIPEMVFFNSPFRMICAPESTVVLHSIVQIQILDPSVLQSFSQAPLQSFIHFSEMKKIYRGPVACFTKAEKKMWLRLFVAIFFELFYYFLSKLCIAISLFEFLSYLFGILYSKIVICICIEGTSLFIVRTKEICIMPSDWHSHMWDSSVRSRKIRYS